MKSFRIALFTLILSSCQLNSYQIDGFAREACEGDTVCMCQDTSLQGAISVTVVENGKFTFVGDTDTMAVYRIFLKKAPERSVTFFLEAGRTTVELSPLAAGNRVSGTMINNEWQQLNDSIRLLGLEIVRIVQQQATDSTTQQLQVKAVKRLHHRMSDCILNTAQRNRSNILGQYILKNYKAPEFD